MKNKLIRPSGEPEAEVDFPMPEHTPTPWILGAEVLQNGAETQNIDSGPRNKGGMYVANVFLKEDAAFIVRAVNSHEALLDALTLALPYVETALEDQGYKPGVVDRMVKQIRTALAEAEKGENK